MGDKWREYRIGEIAEVIMGQSPPGHTYNEQGFGLPFFQGAKDFGTRYPTRRIFCSEPTRIVEKDDVLISVRAPIGRINRAIEKCAIGRGVAAIRGKTYADTTFIEYLLKSHGMAWDVHESEGSVFGNLRKEDLLNLKFKCPPEKERASIASILGALDDKIELNRKMNETLEAMARAIFKSWFVDFDPIPGLGPHKEWQDSPLGRIPKGWRVGTLGEMCEIVMGQSPPGETYNETDEGLPFYQGIRDFSFRFPSKRVYCNAPTRLANEGDVLLSVRAPVGSLNIVSEKCAIGRGVAALRIKGQHYGFLYYLMRETQWEWEKYEAEGTVFGSATKTDVQKFSIIVPPIEAISEFNKVVFPMDETIKNNEMQSHTLASIRDALLPKLLSGEIRVKDAERFVERI